MSGNYCCPRCKNTENLKAVVTVTAEFNQDGDNFETVVEGGDHEWDAHSTMSCGCGFHAPAKWFTLEGVVCVKRSDGRGYYILKPKEHYIEGTANVSISFMIDHNFEAFLDELGEDMCGTPSLMNVTYSSYGISQEGDADFIVSGLLENIDEWQTFLADQVDSSETVICKVCGETALAATAHQHEGSYVGECCWDERLRATE